MSAGQVREAVEQAFRDYVTDGVPSSGEHEPVKSEIRYALGALLEETLSSIGAGIARYETIAERDAAAAPADGSLVYVFRNNDDPADPANGVYQYDAGAPGYELATWYYDAVAAVVQPLVDDAEAAATAAANSASEAAAAARAFSPLKNDPPNGSGMERVLSVVANDDVDLSAIPNLTLRNLGKDSFTGGRYRMNIASENGGVYTNVFTVGVNGNTVMGYGTPTGIQTVTLLAGANGLFPGYALNAPIARMQYDFGDGEDHGNVGTNWTYADAPLDPAKLKMPGATRAVVEQIAEIAATAVRALGGIPWREGMDNDRLRGAVKRAWIYGEWNEIDEPNYGVTLYEAAHFAAVDRFRIQLGDLDDGAAPRCEYSKVAFDPDELDFADLPRFIRLTKRTAVDDRDVEAVFEIDPDFIEANDSTTTFNWTTPEECGFKPECVFTSDQATSHIDAPRAGVTVRLGAGTDFADTEAALPQFYVTQPTGNPSENFQINGKSALAHFARPAQFRAVGVSHRDEPSEKLVFLDCMDFDGQMATLVAPNDDRWCEENFTGRFKNAVCVQAPATLADSQYFSHCDQAGGDTGPTRRLSRLFWNWHMVLGSNQADWGRGCGMADGHVERVGASHSERHNPNTSAAVWGYHNSLGMELGAEFTHASSSDQMRGSAIVLLTSFPSDVYNTLDITGSDHNLVGSGVTWATANPDLPRRWVDRNRGNIVGRTYDDCAISYEDGAGLVLKVPAGSVVTGAGAAELFGPTDYDATYGTVDKYGLGAYTPLDGSKWGVATVLGDLSDGAGLGVTVTLPGGGPVTHTLDDDYTLGQTLQDVADELNATFGAGTVTIERYDRWRIPRAMRQRRGWNNTGAALAKGARVRFVEAANKWNDIRAAADDEFADGFLLQPCKVGDSAVVVIHKAIPRYLLPAVTGNGPVYATGGLISSVGTDPTTAGNDAKAAFEAAGDQAGADAATAIEAAGATNAVAVAIGNAIATAYKASSGTVRDATRTVAERKRIGRCIGDIVKLY